MGQGATPEKLKKIIDGVDNNGNGEIEWVEYLQIMRNFYPHKLAEYEKKFYEPAKNFTEFSREDIDVFVDTFRNYDLDGNGSIDARELEMAFKRMGQGASKEKVEQMIKDADDDGNGTVEWVEFLGIMSMMYYGYKPKTVENKPIETKPTETKPTQTTTPVKSTTTTTTPVKNTTTSSPTTPVKSYSNTPAKNTTTTTPVKTTTTTTTPVKNTTTSSPTTPVKSTSTTPVKTTTTTPPQKGTTTTTTPPQKSTFGGAKPTSTSTSSVTMGSRSANSCASCSKSVYPIEEIKAMGTVFHKGCFRCQSEGCGIQLTLNTFKGANSKVFCSRHAPMDKPTQLTVSGSLALQNATNAPKLQKAQGIKKNERMTFAPGELQPLGQSKEEE